MILADKIILLRRRKGWSQEELAERLGVTRQSISKWEGAQSVPELDKILKMSEVFGVSCDFLLKDDLEPEEVPLSAKKVTFEEPEEEQKPEEEAPAPTPAEEPEEEKAEEETNYSLIEKILYPTVIIALALYFVLGIKIGAWGWAWIFPVVPFISLIIITSLTDKSGENTTLQNLGSAVSYTALLIFLLVGFFHGGWAWAWIFPAVSFISFGIINVIADKSPSETLISKITAVLFGVALLVFLLIGFFHGGWAWAWIIPVGAFVGLTVFRLILDRKNANSTEEE